jgi:ATP-dependent RNA helicase RhlB
MTQDTIAGAEAGQEDSITVASPISLNDDINSNPQGFDGLALSPSVLRAVLESGYTTPTPIQTRGIPLVLKHRDLIGIAQTGTGKTASFTLPMIEILARGRAKARMPRSLILEPTRELAAQVAESFERYGKYNKLSMALLIGGVSFEDQDRKLDRGVDVLIATPGRLLDHFERGKLMLSQVQILVVDEADRMLDMGFIPQVRQIIRQTPPKNERQTLLFSATFTEDVMNLAKQWTTDPSIVEIESQNVASENVEQHIYAVAGADKYKLLYNLVNDNGWERVMVFANRKDEVRRIEERLVRDGVNAAQLSGDVPQHKRIKTLEGFREGKIRVLVATDVAGRGIHIDGISHVINFTLPEVPDDYVHRIGRTGRAGADGVSISFAGEDDSYQLPSIEALLGRKISCETPPTHLLRAVERKRP